MLIVRAEMLPFSWNLIMDIQMLLHYHFMQNAYVAGTLVALMAGMMGYFMVLRGQSFAGHSLANVGFVGATGAVLFGISPIIGLFIAGICAALGIHILNLTTRQSRQSDIASGVILSASLASGFLFIHLATAEYAANILNVLFGNVLGISDIDVSIILWSTLLLISVLAVIARPLFFASLDPAVAAARRVPVRLLSFGYLVLLALEVAVAVQVVGVLLIFALLVTPAAIAQHLTSRPMVALVLAIVLALLFMSLGLTIGYITPYPVGFFITTCAFGTYVCVRVGRFISKRLARTRFTVSTETKIGRIS
ncbi:metal ABC transporter permease [Dictyobacter arantiisoli]|uniref:ABC transporter permease n=1 Tax=Dictyobacter arantiisoli TaxID=2014874 RepID=A0A5A5TBH4_9CHLR|nr:metal ABC transporter permease [Dictyobacter arantiisoli]GCF08585.1 ABC transporter permease [Dictyobacter arantiisoli]